MQASQYLLLTKEYYAHWLSVSPSLLNMSGIHSQFSPERDHQQEGYSEHFDFYGYFSDRTAILSYGNQLCDEIRWISDFLTTKRDFQEFGKLVQNHFGVQPHTDYKYYFDHLVDVDTSHVKQLTLQDYPAYLEFFQTQYPDSEAETWLEEYFTEMVNQGYVFGVFVDGKLVSATDAPDMPYMKDILVEIGINTLPDYRNQGHATAVVIALIKKILNEQKAPIVSCSSLNLASQRLAEKVGFKKFADVVVFSLERVPQ